MENFGNKYAEQISKTTQKLIRSKTNTNQIQYGMEPNICNGGRRGTKNDTKLESFWKQIFGLSNLQQQILI